MTLMITEPRGGILDVSCAVVRPAHRIHACPGEDGSGRAAIVHLAAQGTA